MLVMKTRIDTPNARHALNRSPFRNSHHRIINSVTALAATVLLVGSRFQSMAQSDNFNDGEDLTPVLWTHVDVINAASGGASIPNTYDASSGKYRLTADSGNDVLGLGQARTLALPPDVRSNAFYVSVDLVDWTNTTAQAIGVLARVSDVGPATTDGYAFGIAEVSAVLPGMSYVRILRIENESTKDVKGSGPGGDSEMLIPDLDPAKDYRLVFMGDGSDLEGRLYELPNVTTPVAVVKGNTAGDTIILTSGQCGLLAFGASLGFGVDATFDNYYSSDRCPLSISDLVIKDNFDDGNDTTPAPAWTRYDPIQTLGQIFINPAFPPQNTWSFPGGNTYRLQASASVDPVNFGPGRVASVQPNAQTDFRVAVDVVDWDDTQEQAIGILTRLTGIGPGSTDGYALTYQVLDGDIDISKVTDEAPAGVTVSGEDSFALDPAKTYRFVFTGKGNELRALVFELPETMNPLVDCLGYDSSYASGVNALLGFDNSGGFGTADVTFDNYSDTPIANPNVTLALGTGPAGEITVTWPAQLECVWVLETTSTIGGAWTEVATTTAAVPAAKIIYDPLTGKNTFTGPAPMAAGSSAYYRLRKL